jgi:uncharacterized protein
MNPFQIDPRHLPPEGRQLSGVLPPAFFALAEDDPVRPESPLKYELVVLRDGEDLVLTGRLEAEFSLECGRCLERFRQRVVLDPFTEEIPIEKEGTTDLTEVVREDILLALPNFPRCEDGNVDLRDCPAEGRFEAASPAAADETPGADKGVWDALDQLKN